MTPWMKVEPTRHQVAIAGQVTDAETERAIGGAQVWIAAAPPDFVDRLVVLARLAPLRDAPSAVQAANATLDNPAASSAQRLQAAQVILGYLLTTQHMRMDRPDETCTAADGRFHFLDLPAGAYTLGALLPKAGTRYSQGRVDVTVTRDGEGSLKPMGVANIALRPTTLQGRIFDPNNAPVPLAEVRVKGSGERTFSDAYEDLKGDPQKSTKGRYRLTGLEAGQRLVRVSAQGYQVADDLAVQLLQGETTAMDIQLKR